MRTSDLFHKIKIKTLNITAAFVIAVSSLSGALPLLISGNANALAFGATELRLSSAAPVAAEAGTGTTSFSVKEVVGLGGSGWTNVVTGLNPATVTATVTNGQIATNCSGTPVWGTTATVTVSPVGNVVEGSFCYKSTTTGNHDVSLAASGHFPLLGNIHNTLTVPVTVVDRTAPSVAANGQPSGGIYKNTNVFNYTWDASTDNSDSAITYEYQASQNSHTTSGVLDTNVWNNVINHVNSSQYPLTSALIPSVGTSDGTWYWQVRAIDASGNASDWSQVWSYTLDSQAPVLNVTSPNDGASVNGSFTVKANASDSDGLNAYYVAVDGVGKSYTYHPANGNMPDVTIDTTALSEGSHTLLVRVTDLAGNAAEVHRTFTVDRTAPTVSVTPVEGSLLHGTETFDVTVNDNNTLDTNKNKSVWVYLYDTAGSQKSRGAKVNLSNGHGTFTVDTTKLDDGNANLDVAIIYDAAGNASGKTDNYFRNYTIDNTAPTGLANLSPSNGTVTTTAGLAQIDWTNASDTNGPVAYYYENSNSSATNANGSFASPAYQSGALTDSQIPATGTPEGVYYWHVRAADAAGNSTAWTGAWKVTVDNTAPVANITTPANGAFVRGAVAVNGTVTDTNPDHYYFVVKNASGMVVAGPGTVNHATVSSWSWNTTNMPNGVYTIDLEARDKVGNKDAGSTNTIQVTVDNTKPTLSVDSLANPFVSGNSLDVTGSVNDTNLDYYRYQILDQNKNVIPGSVGFSRLGGNTNVTNGPLFTADLSGLSDGSYWIRVWAHDKAGNQTGDKTVPYVINFTIDNVVPVVTVDALSTTDTTPAATGTVDDSGATVSVTVNGHTYAANVSTTANASGTYNWSADVTDALAVGTYDIAAAAKDAAGNTGNDTTTNELTVNAPNPTIAGRGAGATTFVAHTNTGNPQNNNNGGQVLGAATTPQGTSSSKSNNDNGNVKGDSTVKLQSASDKKGRFLGLGWWWLAILALVAALWLVFMRRRSEEQ